jgi:putative (di)nucleoside polyphosphate hydrolase
MTLPTAQESAYRRSAGVVLFSRQGQVWLGRRAGQQADHLWQFPQGGIDPGESDEFAALRELREETGIAPDKLRVLGYIKQPLFYDFPESYRNNPRTKNWRGQRQSWFAYRFIGDASDVNLAHQSPPEFSDWRWGDLSSAPGLIVPFKRKVYERLVSEFEGFAKPAK